MPEKNTISACLVVHNEEKLIGRCLESIKNLVDEIIVVHDGPCQDKTLEIAMNFTNKIFEREQIGSMEPHLAFAYNNSHSEWMMRIDADEFFEQQALSQIKQLVEKAPEKVGSFEFDWEFWNWSKSVHNKAFRKKILYRRKKLHFIGVTHQIGLVDGDNVKTNVLLRHQPQYNNTSWSTFFRKLRHQVPVHAKFFFPDQVKYECFNYDINVWLQYISRVKKLIIGHIIFTPFKMALGQLKNGLWTWLGLNFVVQTYLYYLDLYFNIWKIKRNSKSQS